MKKRQILADGAATVGGELALGKNVLVAYMPWEGYNFEDAVLISERLVYEDIYTSFHIRKYEIQTYMTSQGPERVTNEIPHLAAHLLRNLDKNGIVRLGSWVEAGDILVGKLTPQMEEESSYAPEDRLLRAILGIPTTSKETCLKLPIGGRGRVIDVRWIQKKRKRGYNYNPEMIHVFILQKREIKVGDKVAGRHGNKGIVSKILPRQDMPYLQDGRPVDMVFNPLGVPSRMNIGQIFECSLGLAGSLLDRHYRIAPFDERHEQEASRKLVFSELYEASKQTANPWVFEPEIFGPIKSGVCACGNYQVIGDEKEDKRFCEQCGVEFVNSRVRRYQMGYIKLACPVTHVWYLKRLPSYIANFLDKPLQELEGLVYCDFSFARPIVKKPTFLRLRGLFEYENQSWKYRIPLFFTIPSSILIELLMLVEGQNGLVHKVAEFTTAVVDLKILVGRLSLVRT
ncbi:hypothetical protein Cgig2_000470 [Carnegiea gigantea]|uniref:DNA-directed RNA polymerase n=1 Tax=Carnegiea gigantea TaxID=171969 RepID=A0A9Q1QD93_9CARY|nr:hypothetical protein Cgig2_000470 [Carnegiea gigantea]